MNFIEAMFYENYLTYKHCWYYFKPFCLLVKMVSKTVTFKAYDLSNVSNTRHSVSSHIKHREETVENTTRSEVFLTNFEVFDIVIKHCVSCLI